MASACPLCSGPAAPDCCERDAAARLEFAALQAHRATILDFLGIEKNRRPRHGGFGTPTEWEIVPDLDSLFAFLEASAHEATSLLLATL